MKFGETLYDRSPRFPNQNFPYNELKVIIKQRTSDNAAASPLPIPGQSSHRWSLLEDDLFQTLKNEHDNIVLFLRSKVGEIERRLAFLTKSVKSAKRWATTFSGRPNLLARKFQKLVYDAEQIGEDIQALSQYAAVQRLAFRKILKKYKKWTNSDGLQMRMENEVFSQGQLQFDFTEAMNILSIQLSRIAELEDAMLNSRDHPHGNASPKNLDSPAKQLNSAAKNGSLQFDSAFASVPFGEAAGTSVYWIHSDNIDEARILLFRYMRDAKSSLSLSRQTSSDSITSKMSSSRQGTDDGPTHVAYCDNAQRFVQHTSSLTPSNAALIARWSTHKKAVIDMYDMRPQSDVYTTVTTHRKDLAPVLDRSETTSQWSVDIQKIKEWMSQHRDVKPLAHMSSHRSRYVGITNSAEVGTFATFDTDIAFSRFRSDDLLRPGSEHEGATKFPHAVLEIRWEFGPRPEAIRAFDSTHLAEKIEGFTLERAAILSRYPELTTPSWAERLNEDIRKVPRVRNRRQDSASHTSAPSSDGPSDSIFSIPEGRSITGSETSPMASIKDDISPSQVPSKKSRKRARIDSQVKSPNRGQSVRYYNEYDDPDSELYQTDTYAIYVDPNEEAPGMATIRKLGGWLISPFTSRKRKESMPEMNGPNERTPLFGQHAYPHQDEDVSSESDSDHTAKPVPKNKQDRQHPLERYRNRLNRRQRAWETTLGRFSSGLLVLAFAFLLMSGTLLTTGRKKEKVEVNAGASTGIFIAFICTFLALILTLRRKTHLPVLERIIFILAIGMISIIGTTMIVMIVQRATR